MTRAPPTPSRPATKAPTRPSATSVAANAGVTLSLAGEVGCEVRERLVRNRLQQSLEGLELIVGRAAPILLEEQHLAHEIAGGLTPEVGDQLGRVASAVGAVAEGALCRRRAPAGRRRRIDRDPRGLPRLRGEVTGDVVDA